ncbi:MAG: hypothetical protein JWO94_2813 [Verrucomicrobiaceae bacterium]|nr:hypothetical protein [Verrucomicrobiaceae bacterium]
MTKTVALSTLDEISVFVSESAHRELNGKDRETLSQAARRLAVAVQGDGYAWQQANWIFTFLKTIFLGTESERDDHRQQILLKGQALSRYLLEAGSSC